MRTLDEHQRATLLDRLFRQVGALDDSHLLKLESLFQHLDDPQPVPPPIPTRQSDPNQLSRRYFLMTLLAGGALAATAGGAAAVALNDQNVRHWLGDQGWLPTLTITPTSGPSPTATASLIPTLPPEAVNQITSLQSQIAALTAERDKLKQQVVALGGQVDDANGQITTLKTNNQNYRDLLDLYHQLEQVGLDDMLSTALGSMGLSMLAVNTVRAALSTGLVLAVRVLQTIEDQMPLIASGLDWLEQQIRTLSAGIRAFQTALQVSDGASLAKSVSDFIGQVLDMLPFGAGQNIKLALQAMGNLIGDLPELLNNVNVQLIGPARAWIVSGTEGGLHDLLLRPLREQLLSPAQQIVANAENLNTVYNNQLAQPAQSALDQRAKIRAEITKKAGALTG